MTRRMLVTVPLVTVAVVLVVRGLPPWIAAAIAGAAGLAVAALEWRSSRAHLRRLADAVNAWVGSAEPQPVEPVPESSPWAELTVALNALGSAYERRGARMRREGTWRRGLVAQVADPALLFAPDDRLIAANGAARDLLGIRQAPPTPTLMQALGNATLAGAVREARDAGRAVVVDAEVGDRVVRATASLLGDEVLLLLTDQTEQRRVEELRRHFVANASHELKTPATAIQALTDALAVATDRSPDRVEGLVRRLDEQAGRLVRLVHDLLDLRRLEEAPPLERTVVDLVAITRAAVAEATPATQEVGVAVRTDLPARAQVAGVAEDLRAIVRNLVANAVQYNRAGGSVRVGLRPDDGAYVLEVADTGIGIPQHELPRIFERFYRVDVARSRERGGTGLGLSIVRHAVQRHGGTVHVESLLGEGTTVTVRIPVEPAG